MIQCNCNYTSQWDTLGQDRFKSVISTCVREAHGIIFVYDVTKIDTLKAIEFWWQFANDYAPCNAVKILVGNQTDLSGERVISTEEGEVRNLLGRSNFLLNLINYLFVFPTNSYRHQLTIQESHSLKPQQKKRRMQKQLSVL